MNANQIRKTFLDYMAARQHEIVPSAPMVIKNDPTLMFNNSGMVQFKEFFVGNTTSKFPRVADTQKCLRVSGKHNDLEEVGKDTYHHTMFEMLGNWSFGDYFKKEAIDWAWDLLTNVYKIDKDRLYVTIFEGDAGDNTKEDLEARKLWEAHVPHDRILLGDKKDNFWEMGEQGPCGPCSEIHVDIRSDEEREATSGASLVNEDHPQVIEVWNLVFMQYNRLANGTLEPLPNKHVDTGMGFERLCMVLQGVQSNYDTDVFTPYIREITTITNTTYGKNEDVDIAIRVIADHLRAVAFSIADGQLPSNTGAGYVIRRILRRAVRYGFTFLNIKEAFIYKLVSTLVHEMGDTFPELQKENKLITNVIREEETSFLRTLDQGLVLLESIVANTVGEEVDGAQAFELYDTFGFPIDLTALILSEKGYTLDEAGFEAEMAKQKNRSRSASKVTTDDWVTLRNDDVQEFIGYDMLESPVRITKYRSVETKKEGKMYQIVLNLTPFYPEGGGQVGDKGYLESSNGDITYVIDTKKENNQIYHLVKELPSNLEEPFNAIVDANQRRRSASNHSATHLLHQALRTILGEHVEQKGSMVHSGYLRFDFSHFSKVTAEQLDDVEQFVNARIQEQLPLEENRNQTYDQAVAQGAIALFGEKYGDTVRTIKFGNSMELCGGTHVANTTDIWHFKITSESAVASGVRRIEAITGDAAKEFFTEQLDHLNQIKQSLKGAQDPVKAITSLQDENAALKKQLDQLKKEKVANLRNELVNQITEVNGHKLLISKQELDAGSVKDLLFNIGGQVKNLVAVIGAHTNGKATLTIYIDQDLASKDGLNAGAMVRELGKHIQGGGGGQPHFATAGGKNPDGLDQALQAAESMIQNATA